MMAATSQEKFNAAVKVIRGLPKNGSFQPSHELMLKFYAYYKQATEGPCTSAKPAIWSIVNRKKWEAWAELGEMEKETAMLNYVEELKNVSKHVKDTLYPPEIVEAMPQTEQVAEFVDTLGAFYELVEEGSKEFMKGAKGTADKQPIGLKVNGEGDDQFDHSASIGEMLKINNNDTKKGSGDPGDSFDKDSAVVPNGVTSNGHKDTTDEDEEDDNSDDDEEEEAEELGNVLEESRRVDSGSDSEEFCDTSDQMVQIPTKLGGLRADPTQMSTSTPVDGKRETRVRFAPQVVMADDDRASVASYGNGLDCSASLRDLSNLSAELMTERLGLGSTTGLSFLPQTTEFPPHKLTGSLQVNNSFSSLTSLAGDSVAGDEVEVEGGGLDAKDLTFSSNSDAIATRGGGQDAMSTQATQGSISSGRGNGSSSWGSRNYSQNSGSSARRGLFPSGSGSGGSRRGGDGRQMSGSLDEQILLTLIRLQQDMTDISNRLASLELTVKLQREERGKQAAKESKWWQFPGMSKKMVFLLIIWPLLAPLVINLLRSRRRASPS